MFRTRGARGSSDLNRTLDESPTHWRVRQQPRKKKHSFGVLPSKYSGSVAGRNTDSVLPKLFFGEKDLAKPRLISRAEEGSGEESARDFASDFFGGARNKLLQRFYKTIGKCLSRVHWFCE